MFFDDLNLVWWNGTKFKNIGITDKTYAKIDNQSQTWYFTDKNEIIVRFIIWDTEYSSMEVHYGSRVTAPLDPIMPWYIFSWHWILEWSESVFDFENEKIMLYLLNLIFYLLYFLFFY